MVDALSTFVVISSHFTSHFIGLRFYLIGFSLSALFAFFRGFFQVPIIPAALAFLLLQVSIHRIQVMVEAGGEFFFATADFSEHFINHGPSSRSSNGVQMMGQR